VGYPKKKIMKKTLIIISLLLAGLSSCEKQVENDRPEFIGYWYGGSYREYGYIYLNINKKKQCIFLYGGL
jgi:nucleoside-specific outer membrane channel protein Tsx